MQLLPDQRRKTMYGLYAFCREVDDIADGDASRELKLTLLSKAHFVMPGRRRVRATNESASWAHDGQSPIAHINR
jgi:phytoene/squalene synthetase